MPRHARHAPGGLIYHVLNRAAGGRELFAEDADYAAFIRVFARTLEATPMRVLGFCLMPTHWHLVLWPERDGELARFMQRLSITHVRRWLEQKKRVGQGSVYQGRFKSFATQDSAHLTTLLRYVERNPVRAGLARRAETWRWSSLGQVETTLTPLIPIAPWPVPRRRDWARWVNQPQTAAEESAIKQSITNSRPYGTEAWTARTEAKLKLPPLRKRGRPAKNVEQSVDD